MQIFYKNEISKAKVFYLTLRKIEYEALSMTVQFNNKGFTHLIRKGKVLRKLEEQYERCALLHLIPEILVKKPFKIEYRQTDKDFFITTHTKINSKYIKIVFRQHGRGLIYFFSIMERL